MPPGRPLAERARQEGFTVHECRNVPAQLRFLAGAGRYDIIHAQTANTVTWAVLTKWLHRRPVAFSRRTSFVVKPNEEWKTGFKWRHVDLFVAISEMAASEPRRLGIEPAIIRSAVEPHAINADNVAALVSEFQLDGRKVMATSAALIQDKDPVTLVRAVAELARTRRDFIFLHFGAGGARSRPPGRGPQAGHRGRLPLRRLSQGRGRLLQRAGRVRHELRGRSLGQQRAGRLPAARAGGVHRRRRPQGKPGRRPRRACAVGDHQALAAGMARCLDDAAFRQEVTERAYAYVRDEHDVQKMGNRYLAQFERVLEGR